MTLKTGKNVLSELEKICFFNSFIYTELCVVTKENMMS